MIEKNRENCCVRILGERRGRNVTRCLWRAGERPMFKIEEDIWRWFGVIRGAAVGLDEIRNISRRVRFGWGIERDPAKLSFGLSRDTAPESLCKTFYFVCVFSDTLYIPLGRLGRRGRAYSPSFECSTSEEALGRFSYFRGAYRSFVPSDLRLYRICIVFHIWNCPLDPGKHKCPVSDDEIREYFRQGASEAVRSRLRLSPLPWGSLSTD